MGWNDHIDDGDEAQNLPPEAFDHSCHPIDIDDAWLESASEEEQTTAMRSWFASRFCDPAEDTPYNGREGGYMFVNGGPYDPRDVLPERFSEIVSDSLIDSVVEEMLSEHGDQWAPVYFGPPDDYFDERFDLHFLSQEEPLNRLRERLRQAQSVLTLKGNAAAKQLAEKLVFGAIIGALEAFLWETVSYWVENDEMVLRNLVTKLDRFKNEPMKLGEIFDRQASLKKDVQGHLQNIVWHRWDKVAPLFKVGLGVQMGSTKVFEDALVKRHDIVHRSGHDKSGVPIQVTMNEIQQLSTTVVDFCADVEARLAKRSELIDPGETS